MNMPGFTADLCLRNADQRYQVSALEHQTDQTIQPALMGPQRSGNRRLSSGLHGMHTPIGQSHVVKQAVAIPVLPKVAVAEYKGISRQRRYVGTAIFFVNRPRETYSWRVEESGKCGIMAESGEDVAWDEAWELLWARE